MSFGKRTVLTASSFESFCFLEGVANKEANDRRDETSKRAAIRRYVAVDRIDGAILLGIMNILQDVFFF